MSPVDLVHLGIALAWLALAVVLVRVRAQEHRLGAWLAVATGFCVLRALDFGLVQTGMVDLRRSVFFVDVVLLVALVVMVFATDRLRRGLSRQHQHAAHAEAEYSRALLDYTQLVRHRIANPLTAISGGIQTLLDLDLPEATRRQLLDSMLSSARRLEEVALHPERITPEEAGLEPAPAPLRAPSARRALELEGGHIEADFRDVNAQLIDALPDDHGALVSFVCECSARECSHPVVMSLGDYWRTHGDGAQFVIAPGHDVPAIEDVVHQERGWWVVRKRGSSARDARRRAGAWR